MSLLDMLRTRFPAQGAPPRASTVLPATQVAPSSAFPRALEHVLAEEGGYVNDPADPGGETKYGISKRAHPELDIKALTPTQAAEVYRASYWNVIRGDELPPAVALAVFDGAVNQGPAVAAKQLQAAVGTAQDGAIGPRTIAATRSKPVKDVLVDVLVGRVYRYIGLPGFARYGRGWLRRVIRTAMAAAATP